MGTSVDKIKGYYAVAIYYWSRSTPTYLSRNWREKKSDLEVYGEESYIALSREEAEAEAVLFSAAHPRYFGSVSVEWIKRKFHLTPKP